MELHKTRNELIQLPWLHIASYDSHEIICKSSKSANNPTFINIVQQRKGQTFVSYSRFVELQAAELWVQRVVQVRQLFKGMKNNSRDSKINFTRIPLTLVFLTWCRLRLILMCQVCMKRYTIKKELYNRDWKITLKHRKKQTLKL